MSAERVVLITGGAGFVGSNLAARLLAATNTRVRILDNLSRRGVGANLAWLRSHENSRHLEFVETDVRNAARVARAAEDATEVYHFAAQVAVTTSVDDPRADLETNAVGTFNVLEAARRSGNSPFLLFTSTNKVYGSMDHIPIAVENNAYRATDPGFAGVDESAPLDFHSPYGCSKGSADQYVRDYARIYHLPTVVFRMSCIAGPRQFGTEDQGWIAHFLYSVLEHQTISIYGDGCQVRDVLHIEDLLDAIGAARNAQQRTAGQIYNVGGGLSRALSVRAALGCIEELTGIPPRLAFSPARPGDQPLYISKVAKLHADTGWSPRHSISQILADIHRFWIQNRDLLSRYRTSLITLESPLDRTLVAQGGA